MIRTIINQYLLLLALVVIYEVYVVIKSDLALIEATGILRSPLQDNNSPLIKQGYDYVTKSVKISPENPRAHHYRAIYLARLSFNSDYAKDSQRKKLLLDESMQETMIARKAMPLNWHLEKDMIWIAKIKWQAKKKAG